MWTVGNTTTIKSSLHNNNTEYCLAFLLHICYSIAYVKQITLAKIVAASHIVATTSNTEYEKSITNLQSEIVYVSWTSCEICDDWQKKSFCACQKMMVSSLPLLPLLQPAPVEATFTVKKISLLVCTITHNTMHASTVEF